MVGEEAAVVGSVALLGLGAHDGGVGGGEVGARVLTAVHHTALQGHRHPVISGRQTSVKILQVEQPSKPREAHSQSEKGTIVLVLRCLRIKKIYIVCLTLLV